MQVHLYVANHSYPLDDICTENLDPKPSTLGAKSLD